MVLIALITRSLLSKLHKLPHLQRWAKITSQLEAKMPRLLLACAVAYLAAGALDLLRVGFVATSRAVV